VYAGGLRVQSLLHLLHGDDDPCAEKIIGPHGIHDVGVQADVVSKTTALVAGEVHATVEKAMHPITVVTMYVAVLVRLK
jgi:hypothetical protein